MSKAMEESKIMQSQDFLAIAAQSSPKIFHNQVLLSYLLKPIEELFELRKLLQLS